MEVELAWAALLLRPLVRMQSCSAKSRHLQADYSRQLPLISADQAKSFGPMPKLKESNSANFS